MIRFTSRFLVLITLALAAGFAPAQVVLDVSNQYKESETSNTEEHSFDVPAGTRIGITLSSKAELGVGRLILREPDGSTLEEFSLGAGGPVVYRLIGPFDAQGTFSATVETEAFIGEWGLSVVRVPAKEEFYPYLLTGPLMMLIAVLFSLGWYFRTRAAWRWFAVGAGLWVLGVALKFAFAIPLNGPILGALSAALPHGPYIMLGSLYIGLLTGVFEIAVILPFAWKWRNMALEADRAVAFGLGAGCIEALLLGMAGLANAAALLSDNAAVVPVVVATSAAVANTPVVWLAGPVERIIAIAVHVASRMFVLHAVASGRYRHFWVGFGLLTAVDMIAGWLHLSGNMGGINLWFVELALLPLAVLGAALGVWLYPRWPAQRAAAPPTGEGGLNDPGQSAAADPATNNG